MLTDLSKIVSDLRVDFGLFVLHFLEFRFYKFLVEKKKICALHAQIGTVFFELIDQKYRFFGFAFYLTIQKVDHGVLLQDVLLYLKDEGLVDVED